MAAKIAWCSTMDPRGIGQGRGPSMAAKRQNWRMHGGVGLVKAIKIVDFQRVFLQTQVAAQLTNPVIGDGLGELFHSHQFQRLGQKGAFADLGQRKARHIGARLWDGTHQMFHGQARHSLEERSARDARLRTNLGLAQDIAGAKEDRKPRLAQAGIDALGERPAKVRERAQVLAGGNCTSSTSTAGGWRWASVILTCQLGRSACQPPHPVRPLCRGIAERSCAHEHSQHPFDHPPASVR